jgi:(2R)-sulfolactate sulfo-lyase subunit alpha
LECIELIYRNPKFTGIQNQLEGRRMIHFLVHDPSDDVGVAVVDIESGTHCAGRILSNNQALEASAIEVIPLGHKIALRDFAVGDTVTKYNCPIGKVVAPIKAGQHVHVHNLKTKRWA